MEKKNGNTESQYLRYKRCILSRLYEPLQRQMRDDPEENKQNGDQSQNKLRRCAEPAREDPEEEKEFKRQIEVGEKQIVIAQIRDDDLERHVENTHGKHEEEETQFGIERTDSEQGRKERCYRAEYCNVAQYGKFHPTAFSLMLVENIVVFHASLNLIQ